MGFVSGSFCMMKKYESGKDEKIRQAIINLKSIIFRNLFIVDFFKFFDTAAEGNHLQK